MRVDRVLRTAAATSALFLAVGGVASADENAEEKSASPPVEAAPPTEAGEEAGEQAKGAEDAAEEQKSDAEVEQ